MLKKYYGQNIEIIDTDGKRWTGYVDEYIYPDDNESGKEAIVLDSTGGKYRYIQFEPTDIESIRIATNSDSLKRYYRKRVELVDSNGRQWSGVVTDYYFPKDNKSGKESILLHTSNDYYIEFEPDDINKIKVIL